MDYKEDIENRREIEAVATAYLASSNIVEPKIGNYSDKLVYHEANTKYWEKHTSVVIGILNKKIKSLI